MKANKRYTEESTSSGNLTDTTVSSISNRPHNFQSYRQPLRNFCDKNLKIGNLTTQETCNFKAISILIYANKVIFAIFTENFGKCQLNVKVLNASFLIFAYIRID